jgi:GDP-mannose 6-dehydrogenase
MDSNRYQIERAFNSIEAYGKRNIAILGLSFKAGTDDLRESPLVDLAELLIGRGYKLKIFDRNVEYARVHGANKDYINMRIPHISSLLDNDLDQIIKDSEIIVLGNQDESFSSLVRDVPADKRLLDLVGFMPQRSANNLEGICW